MLHTLSKTNKYCTEINDLNIQINATICTCMNVHFNDHEYKNAKLYNITITMKIKQLDNKIQVCQWQIGGFQ